MTHWCRDIPRDEAVRAAEDGRSGPLPTLAEAIAAITNHDAPPGARVSESPCAGHADTGADTAGTGLRTERVTLEVTHNEFFPVREWSWITMLRLRPGESVRVVEEFGSALPKVVESMADEIKRLESDRDAARVEAEHDVREVLAMARLERDAAIRERDAHKARVDYLERDRKVWALQSGSFEKEANALRARVAELESAPPARGWLTEEEREAVQCVLPFADDPEQAKTLTMLLARSSPPEVVLEDFTRDAVRNLDAKYLAGWDQCMALAKRALAAAGVTVTEANR